jgi:hypothetical protein
MQLKIEGRENVKVAEYAPGNGSVYKAYAMRDPLRPAHWCVSFPEWGTCMEVMEGCFIAQSYIGEKMATARSGHRISEVDLSEAAKLITVLVPGMTAEVCTNERGLHDPAIGPGLSYPPRARAAA